MGMAYFAKCFSYLCLFIFPQSSKPTSTRTAVLYAKVGIKTCVSAQFLKYWKKIKPKIFDSADTLRRPYGAICLKVKTICCRSGYFFTRECNINCYLYCIHIFVQNRKIKWQTCEVPCFKKCSKRNCTKKTLITKDTE
jgi:hypothetical protein